MGLASVAQHPLTSEIVPWLSVRDDLTYWGQVKSYHPNKVQMYSGKKKQPKSPYGIVGIPLTRLESRY